MQKAKSYAAIFRGIYFSDDLSFVQMPKYRSPNIEVLWDADYESNLRFLKFNMADPR